MEDDGAGMADYGTDDADGVDPNYDAKARPQQASTDEIRSRRSFAGASREVPEYGPHAACESTGMILAAEYIPSQVNCS
jgi:hypothetical protein